MISFVETRLFTRLVKQCLTDDSYAELQAELNRKPDLGAIVRRSGGVRKMRWAAPGRGKSGGYRVIYYVRREQGVIWMLTIYPKNVADSIPGYMLRKIKEEIESGE